MSLRRRYLEILSGILPVGAAGVLLLLGSTAPAGADQSPAAQKRTADPARISERLAAIRQAVSDVARPGDKVEENRQQLAWVAWRNGGGGGGWRNGGGGWRNGGGAWRNGGGAWGNGGWHNGWHNYWHNW